MILEREQADLVYSNRFVAQENSGFRSNLKTFVSGFFSGSY